MGNDRNQANDDRYTVLPFYLLADVSGSMSGQIGTLNLALGEFRDTLAKNPILADKVRFGVVDFSDTSQVVVPLCDFSEADVTNRQLAVRGGTSFAAAFTTMREVIDHDFDATTNEKVRFFRPAVFFLTDGYPNHGDPWLAAFEALTEYDPHTRQGFARYPLFVPFGIGDADPSILGQLVHPQDRSVLFMTKDGANAASAIERMLEAMLMSVISSGRTAANAEPQHVLPKQGDMGPDIQAYPGGNFPG